ncbi:hypothetical protein SAMN04488107_1394 [Geodermatophilus saharensis]|uniref:Uncharacterized protein n=1 Tax=Geodermatophilus saharensis TaxID=1137994 RepID=A0A239BSF0_9ACTN|nr:hypothetical protein [Geodermatophilus saharensis]SNS10609.1 hypothetical protein SAMN04488107_1394 [Geodermatophilus saharensis]
MNDHPSPTPSGNRWEPSTIPAWHPEHVPADAASGPSRTATADAPAVSSTPAGSTPTGGAGTSRQGMPSPLRKRAAAGAAAAALLAIGGAGGFAVGSAAAGDTGASVVQQGGGTADPDGDGLPGGRPNFGQGVPPGPGGTPPGLDDGTTDDGTTDEGTTDGTTGGTGGDPA